jgi:SAM-dependent methyltransferase
LTDGATAIPEVQALLRVLATGRDVAELGAAFGETAALLAETARSVVTVEREPERGMVARERLAGLANVELLEGDAYEQLRGRGPFGLVFADGGRPYDWEAILDLVAPGGPDREGRPHAGPSRRRGRRAGVSPPRRAPRGGRDPGGADHGRDRREPSAVIERTPRAVAYSCSCRSSI